MSTPISAMLIPSHSWLMSCHTCGQVETFPKKQGYSFCFDACCTKCGSTDYILSRVADENPSPKCYSVPSHLLEIPAVLRRLPD